MADKAKGKAGPSARYYLPKHLVASAPTPLIELIDELAHTLRVSRSDVVLYLIELGAQASPLISAKDWRATVAASRHSEPGRDSDEKPSGKAKYLTDLAAGH